MSKDVERVPRKLSHISHSSKLEPYGSLNLNFFYGLVVGVFKTKLLWRKPGPITTEIFKESIKMTRRFQLLSTRSHSTSLLLKLYDGSIETPVSPNFGDTIRGGVIDLTWRKCKSTRILFCEVPTGKVVRKRVGTWKDICISYVGLRSWNKSQWHLTGRWITIINIIK